MLFILFGSTVEMGKKSRLFFEEHGFELIQKFNYIPGDPVVQARFDRRKQSSREEVENCDFVYENNGMLIGFNKEQIIDSVRGRKNCLLTLSSDTIEFIRQIKAAYGGYVTIVGVYIDQLQLKKMFEAIPDLTREELEARLKTGEMVKKIMLEERKLFDEIVIYGGEDSLFDFQGLHSQYEWMIEKASRKEKELNDKTYVEMPYSGKEDYIFVSYAHQDSDAVFPVLAQLQQAGCRVWYDEGIKGGENWRKILATKIQSEACVDFFLFSSRNSTKSKHVQAEVNAALNCEKKITTIRLDDSRFELDLEMYLQIYQILYSSDSAFASKILQAVTPSARVKEKRNV